MHPQPGGNTTDASGLLGPVSRKQTSSIKVGAQAPGLEEQSSLHSHAESASEHGQRPHTVSVPIPYPRLLTSKNSEDLDSDDFGLSPGSLPSTYKSHTNLDAASASRPMEGGWLRTREQWLGALSMVLLIVQGTALSLTLRISRTRPGPQYLASVAVIWTEVIKLAICVGAQGRECYKTAAERGHTVSQSVQHQASEILGQSYPMLLPAGLFVMQQVLVIIAASHLDAVTFQICSQSFKIMPTALFAVWLLGQHLAPIQWASLPVLAVGVVFVTMNNSASSSPSDATKLHLLLGLGASALSGLSSAYAGVYFEKYVKGKLGQTLWVRNLQLSIYGVPLAIAYSIVKDGKHLADFGFLHGFDWMVWSVVALQVFGGLIVGMVVKYADNILKNFANALSVILTVLGAIPLFGQIPSAWFIVGVAIVMSSVFMYQKATPTAMDSSGLWRGAGTWLDSLRGRGGARRGASWLCTVLACSVLMLTVVGGALSSRPAFQGAFYQAFVFMTQSVPGRSPPKDVVQQQ